MRALNVFFTPSGRFDRLEPVRNLSDPMIELQTYTVDVFWYFQAFPDTRPAEEPAKGIRTAFEIGPTEDDGREDSIIDITVVSPVRLRTIFERVKELIVTAINFTRDVTNSSCH